MAIVLEAITHVWFAGRMIPPGEKFSADDDFGRKLIEGASAKVHKAVTQQSAPDPHAELTKAFMALKLDDLRALAEENNVELSVEDNTKAEISRKLIDAGVKPDEANI